MPPKKQRDKESLVLLINVGVTCPGTRNVTILEKSKIIAQRIVERKIFLRPTDEIGIILMGSSVTKNSLQTEHVEEFTNFEVPNWDMVEKIHHLKGTDFCSNWVEAVFAALEYIQKNVIDDTAKKIVLLSDFNEEQDIVSRFTVDNIAEMFQTAQVQLITIGEQSLEARSNHSFRPSEVLLKGLYEKIDGQHETFDSAISDLRIYKQVEPKPYPWYCVLELYKIKIPIATYITTTDVVKSSPWKESTDNERVKIVTEYMDRQKSSYEADEIDKGFIYGSIPISVYRNLENRMKYQSGSKCYNICSFAKKDTVGLEYWCDCSTRVVVPSNQEAVKAFYTLVQAMEKRGVVAIVRKVYSTNSTPRMVALFPCIDRPDEPWCLVEVALPFAEDRRIIDTRPLKSVVKHLSDEQLNAVDSYLDSLMLTDTESDNSHSFLPGRVPDPMQQHKWNILSYRALNPDRPLPPIDDSLKQILEVQAVQIKSHSQLEEIARLFDMEKIKPKKQKDAEGDLQEGKGLEALKFSGVKESSQSDETEVDSLVEPVLSLDTMDIDLDELAANI